MHEVRRGKRELIPQRIWPTDRQFQKWICEFPEQPVLFVLCARPYGADPGICLIHVQQKPIYFTDKSSRKILGH